MCGIGPNNIDRHFWEEHKDMPLETRKDIVTWSQTLLLCEVEEVTRFQERTSHINGLEIRNGYRCNFSECGMIKGTQSGVQRHCTEHKWDGFVSGKARFCEVKVQTFFQGNKTWYTVLLIIH